LQSYPRVPINPGTPFNCVIFLWGSASREEAKRNPFII
jgi:hypothetical protein